MWSADTTQNIKLLLNSDVKERPGDKDIWVFGTENLYANVIKKALKDYDAELTIDSVRFAASSYANNKNSIVISVRHPENPARVIVFLSADNKDAVPGLARKLPHYGKYSYLVFEGTEPANIAKGEWEAVNSPLEAKLGDNDSSAPAAINTGLPKREALASLDPVFSAERMMKTVNYLASKELEGRGPGSEGINKAADYIAEQFKNAGLLPGSDDGTYFQTWQETVDAAGNKSTVKNIIGIIPGTNPDLK